MKAPKMPTHRAQEPSLSEQVLFCIVGRFFRSLSEKIRNLQCLFLFISTGYT